MDQVGESHSDESNGVEVARQAQNVDRTEKKPTCLAVLLNCFCTETQLRKARSSVDRTTVIAFTLKHWDWLSWLQDMALRDFREMAIPLVPSLELKNRTANVVVCQIIEHFSVVNSFVQRM